MFVRGVCNSFWEGGSHKRALYDGKSVCRDYWLHLHSCKEFLHFKSCKIDPDVYMREAVKYDGTDYCEYVTLYVYD